MEKPLENCNTATPQQREQNDARIGSAERQRGSTSVSAAAKRAQIEKSWAKIRRPQ